MFPAEPRLAKIVNEDAILSRKSTDDSEGESRRIPVTIPKGSVVLSDITGVHYSRKQQPETVYFVRRY